MSQQQNRFRIGKIVVDPHRGCVGKNNSDRYLRQQTFQLLIYLLQHRDRLVPKQELFDKIWRDTVVSDNALSQCIAELRRFFGDDAHQARFIKTVPRLGYRFVGSVVEESSQPTAPEAAGHRQANAPAPARRPGSWSGFKLAGVVAAVLILGTIAAFTTVESDSDDAQKSAIDGSIRKTVAVFDFEHQSKGTELEWLGEGLADMLITDLARSRALSLLSRQQLEDVRTRVEGVAADRAWSFETARRVASRAKAEFFILGSFARIEQQTRINAQVYDTADGELIAAEGITAFEPDRILTRVGLLSRKLASLWEAPRDASGAKGLQQVLTHSLEAYRYYSLGVKKAQAYHTREAVQLWEKAIALDTEFAMALARIGYAYAVVWNNARDKAKPHLEKALALPHRLTEKDRLTIAAWYAVANRDNRGAIGFYRRVIEHDPYDVESYRRLSHLLQGQGHHEESLQVLLRALQADPEAATIYNELGFKLGGEEGIEFHRRYVELAPNEANAYDSLGLSYIESGRYQQALEAFGTALDIKPDFHFANLHVADVYYALGRHQDAERQYRRYLELAPSDWDRSVGYHRLTALYLDRGDLDQAQTAAQLEFESGTDFGGIFLVSMARGDLDSARRHLERLDTESAYTEEEQLDVNDQLAYFRGLLALETGATEEAWSIFRRIADDGKRLWNITGREACLAEAYLNSGLIDEAVQEYRKLLEHNPNYPPALYGLGVALHQKGDNRGSRTALGDFLKLWSNADPGLLRLVDAQARLSSLQRGAELE